LPGESKVKISDEAAHPPAAAPLAATQPQTPPSMAVMAVKEATQKPAIPKVSGDNPAVQNLIKRAKSLRERGQYADARRELEKASAIAPDSAAVRAEIDNVKKACNTEREILGQTGLNCG
jgi:hypothetical protein